MDQGEVCGGGGGEESALLLGGERTGYEDDTNCSEIWDIATCGEHIGQERGEKCEREGDKTPSAVNIYEFMDVPPSVPPWEEPKGEREPDWMTGNSLSQHTILRMIGLIPGGRRLLSGPQAQI
jgi:hypothetical protein